MEQKISELLLYSDTLELLMTKIVGAVVSWEPQWPMLTTLVFFNACFLNVSLLYFYGLFMLALTCWNVYHPHLHPQVHLHLLHQRHPSTIHPHSHADVDVHLKSQSHTQSHVQPQPRSHQRYLHHVQDAANRPAVISKCFHEATAFSDKMADNKSRIYAHLVKLVSQKLRDNSSSPSSLLDLSVSLYSMFASAGAPVSEAEELQLQDALEQRFNRALGLLDLMTSLLAATVVFLLQLEAFLQAPRSHPQALLLVCYGTIVSMLLYYHVAPKMALWGLGNVALLWNSGVGLWVRGHVRPMVSLLCQLGRKAKFIHDLDDLVFKPCPQDPELRLHLPTLDVCKRVGYFYMDVFYRPLGPKHGSLVRTPWAYVKALFRSLRQSQLARVVYFYQYQQRCIMDASWETVVFSDEFMSYGIKSLAVLEHVLPQPWLLLGPHHWAVFKGSLDDSTCATSPCSPEASASPSSSSSPLFLHLVPLVKHVLHEDSVLHSLDSSTTIAAKHSAAAQHGPNAYYFLDADADADNGNSDNGWQYLNNLVDLQPASSSTENVLTPFRRRLIYKFYRYNFSF